MPRALLDSTTFIDLERTSRNRSETWASNTIRHTLDYRTVQGNPFLSIVTVVEILRGLYRDVTPSKADLFKQTAPQSFSFLDVTSEVGYLASEIIGKLEGAGLTIGFPDAVIAATAIHHELDLVTSNNRHFQRVTDLGYPLALQNWREE